MIQVGSEQSLALVRAFMALERVYDGFERAASELEAVKAAPICIEGCGRCCEVNTPFCWEIEANHILSDLLGKGRLGVAVDAAESWMLDHRAGLTVFGPGADSVSAEGRSKILKETWVAARSPCPFLDREKRCEIHDVRPLACRAYGVSRVPSQHECRAPLGRGETESRRAHNDGSALKAAVATFLANLRPDQRVSYFLPWALMRQGRRDKGARLQDRMATARMVAFPESPAILWQEQLDALWRAGVVR